MQSLIITVGWTAGLASWTQQTKKVIVLVILLNVSIQVTGMPNLERSALSAGTPEPRKLNLQTMAPPVPSDDRKKKHVLEMSHIVRGIDANESAIPEAPERVDLERGLHTQNKSVPLQP